MNVDDFIRKRDKVVIKVKGITLLFIICFNIYYSLFYYKPTKRKIDKTNLFNGNDISISEEETKKILNELENNLKIEVETNFLDDYLILDSINNNDDLKNKDRYSLSLVRLFKDNKYMNKEKVYKNLLNVEIIYNKKLPFGQIKGTMGVYNDNLNSIGLFEENENSAVTFHELVHCIFSAENDNKLPRFFEEGMTQILTNEYFLYNIKDKQNYTYIFECSIVKMILEIVSPDIVLKAFTERDISYIIDDMIKYDVTKQQVKKAIDMVEDVLNETLKNKKHKYSVNEFYNDCLLVFQKCIDKKYNYDYELTYLYYYNEMLFYNCLFEDNAYNNYYNDINQYGYECKAYFSSYLKECINNNVYPYNKYKTEIENKQLVYKNLK